MKIGVLMTAYNAAPYIRQALESILRQRSSEFDFDIVIVNDGSTDETADIVRGIGAPEIRLIETPNQGVTKARNVALNNIADDVELLTSLDADDLFPAERFARDVRNFVADSALDLLYGYALHFRDTAADGLSPAEGSRTQMIRSINLGCGLYRRDFVSLVGTFDETLVQAEDTDWILRMFERGPRYKLIDDVCLYYRRHDGNMTRNPAVVRRHFARALMKSMQRRRISGGR